MNKMTSDASQNTDIMIDTLNADAIKVSLHSEEFRFFFDDELINTLPDEFDMTPENEDLQEPCLFIDRSDIKEDTIEFNIYDFLSAHSCDDGSYIIKGKTACEDDIEYVIKHIPCE